MFSLMMPDPGPLIVAAAMGVEENNIIVQHQLCTQNSMDLLQCNGLLQLLVADML